MPDELADDADRDATLAYLDAVLTYVDAPVRVARDWSDGLPPWPGDPHWCFHLWAHHWYGDSPIASVSPPATGRERAR